jgi:hypothetical protein
MQDLCGMAVQYWEPSVEEVATFAVFIRHCAGEFGGGRSRL